MVNSYFEIDGSDIARLNDADLRELVGRLCEAEFRRNRLDPSGVFWGGHQNAADGGFDVLIDCVNGLTSPAFLARKRVGIQVKKPKMPPSKIGPELCPNGALRDEIIQLIADGGGYLIVSSGDSCSASALSDRVKAMRSAVAQHDPQSRLLLDLSLIHI